MENYQGLGIQKYGINWQTCYMFFEVSLLLTILVPGARFIPFYLSFLIYILFTLFICFYGRGLVLSPRQ